REAREPVAYILGRRAFRRLALAVDPRVLIPRPETELLVEAALELPRGARVLDVGTGSGAVALALADERPDLRVRGTDISAAAVAVARENAARLGLDVRFTVCDLLDGEPCDAVVANLPYVAAGERLADEIALYEPSLALFAGSDGLDVVRRLVAALAEAGSPAFVVLEIDPRQAAAAAALVRDAGWLQVQVLRDLAGRERVVVGRERVVAGRA
ncbi:MAG: peptide chain release factor N(5)-glutamine methyltransferase, partial [Solirubrobacteraceae bacterium]